MTPSSDSSDLNTSTVQSNPPSLILHSRLTLVSKPLTDRLPILYLLPIPPHHRPLLLTALLCPLPPLLPLTPSRFFNGMLEAFEPGALNYLHFLLSHPVDLICIQKSNLNSSSSFQVLGFSALRSDRTHSWSGILSRDATNASGGVIIFIRQGLSFSELSTSSLSSLDPNTDYVGVNISLNNSSSLSFLNVYTPLFALFQRMAGLTPFLPPFFSPPENSSFCGTLAAITPSGTQEVLPTPAEKYSTGSSLLTSTHSMTLTHPPFYIAPLLTSPLLPLLLPFLAPGRCFKTWVLITYQFFYLSLSLRSFTPTSVLLPSAFRKLAGMTLLPTWTPIVLPQRNTRLFLFSLQLLSLPLWH